MSATVLLRRVSFLLTCDEFGEGPLGLLRDTSILLGADQVLALGADAEQAGASEVVEGKGLLLLPGLVDAHTHAVWAGSRAEEWRRRLHGEEYSVILAAGGGIHHTVRATRAASRSDLLARAAERLAGMAARGVVVAEVKSGYGLRSDVERRLLEVAVEAGHREGIHVVPTFLGAHAVPEEYRGDREGYLRSLVEDQLPSLGGRARFVDVYVDRGAFSLEEGERVLAAAAALGLGRRIHAEQVTYTGAAAMAARWGARSADHLERLDEAGIAAMAGAGTVAGLLPMAMLSLRDSPPPIAALREAGVPLMVATDLNPGTSPLGDLWTAASLACHTLRLTPEEALLGITRVAAQSLDLPRYGRLRPGGPAAAVLVAPPAGEDASVAALVHHLTGPRVRRVFRPTQLSRPGVDLGG